MPVQANTTLKRKRCHGNRPKQRFRRQCRRRGIRPEQIEQLWNERGQLAIATTNVEHRPTQAVRSRSQPSHIIKKRKKKNNKIKKEGRSRIILKKTKNYALAMNYRRPLYLKQSNRRLFRILEDRLEISLKSKKLQKCIYRRLNFFDQQYCLDVHLTQWQSYYDLGLSQRRWPEQLHRMAKTDDYQLNLQYLTHYLESLRKSLGKCRSALSKQLTPEAVATLPMAKIDQALNDYVESQRKHLKVKNQARLDRFKTALEKETNVVSFDSATDRIHYEALLKAMNTIREKQCHVWQELLILELRIRSQFLPVFFDRLEHALTMIDYTPTGPEPIWIELKNKRYRTIQETKRTCLNLLMHGYELEIQRYDQEYQLEYGRFIAHLVKHNRCSETLVQQIQAELQEQTKRWKETIYRRLSGIGKKVRRDRRRNTSSKVMIGVSPEPYLALAENPFTRRQWNYLSLGPSCIRMNQSLTRSAKQQQVEIKKLHKDMFTSIQDGLLWKQSIRKTCKFYEQYSTDLLHYLQHCYATPASYKDQMQAERQASTAKSIRRRIRTSGLILRVTDKGNNFYIGSMKDFETKVNAYFTQTNAFRELDKNPFHETFTKVKGTLNKMRRENRIKASQHTELMPNSKTVELAHLYFNPKTHKDGVPVRPIESTLHAITKNIADFLDRHIRPIFDRECASTIVVDGGQLIQELQTYAQQGRLKRSTLFCTFDIRNLYTMLPQEQALTDLLEFLDTHGYKQIEKINLQTIRELARIVLEENVLVYGKKIYRQILGGAMGSSFTLTLANIYMWKWQKRWVDRQRSSGEIFRRYIDDIFMTWNGSEKDLIECLTDANTWDRHIQLDYKIGKSLPFLDAVLTNAKGRLETCVYHKPAAQPYVIPFISDHPRHVFRNIVQSTLRRAVRYSSTFEIFQAEQRYIKLMLLYNGYPSYFIDTQFRRFFTDYLAFHTFLPMVESAEKYMLLHEAVLKNASTRQPSTDQGGTPGDDAQESSSFRTRPSSATPSSKPIVSEKKKLDKIIVHYIHENRFRSFKKGIHQIHQKVLKDTPALETRLIVGNRNRRSAKFELIRKRPPLRLLKDLPLSDKHKKKPKRAPSAPIEPMETDGYESTQL